MIVQFKDVCKSYGGVKALQHADVTLKSGEIRALLGGNGSGKSTLIKVASGLVPSDCGEIYIDDVKANIHSPKSAKKLGIVATSQELSILPNLTVGENIALCAVPQKALGFTDYKTIRAKSISILDELGLHGKIDTPISSLALNEQYLIELGKAMFQDFDILLIDEVTSALYDEDVKVVKRILNKYKEEGKIIVFVSHRMKEIRDMCDTVTVMRNGEIIETCVIDDVDDDYLLSLMIGERKTAEPTQSSISAKAESADNADRDYIKIRNLRIPVYGTEVNLDMAKGEIIGVAGLQGHGQSDIVRALHGMYGPIEIEIGGREIAIRSPIDAVKEKIAFVSGDREAEGSFRQHDLAENVSSVKELILKEKIPSYRDVLDMLNVKYASENQSIVSLSGGNQQKVIFARWICSNPVLLLADDPSKGIDANARSEMQQILKELAMNGTSMIIVSSDDDELEKLCRVTENSRVIVMYEGEIVETLRGDRITRDNIIEASHAKGRVMNSEQG